MIGLLLRIVKRALLVVLLEVVVVVLLAVIGSRGSGCCWTFTAIGPLMVLLLEGEDGRSTIGGSSSSSTGGSGGSGRGGSGEVVLRGTVGLIQTGEEGGHGDKEVSIGIEAGDLLGGRGAFTVCTHTSKTWEGGYY